MTEQSTLKVLAKTVYNAVFLEPLRSQVQQRFESDSYIELSDRLTGVGLLMTIIGGISVALTEANINLTIGSNNPIQLIGVVNPVIGIVILLTIYGFSILVKIAADDGIPVNLNVENEQTALLLNAIRIIFGLALLIGMFGILGENAYGTETLIDELVEFASVIGILCLILAPIFWGVGLLISGLLNFKGLYQGTSHNTGSPDE